MEALNEVGEPCENSCALWAKSRAGNINIIGHYEKIKDWWHEYSWALCKKLNSGVYENYNTLCIQF